MELLVFYPSDTRPKKRHFDGPVSLGVKQAVGENPELVPGFTSISRDGVIYPCVAYCDREAKQTSSPMKEVAKDFSPHGGYTAHVHRRDGSDMGLYDDLYSPIADRSTLVDGTKGAEISRASPRLRANTSSKNTATAHFLAPI